MISVLFLSCKRIHFLERTVASIRQHLRELEPGIPVQYLCFDNGSSPEDQRRILALGFDSVQFSATNLGIGPAMNRLVAAVRTSYILNLQDDWVVNNPERIPFLSECLRILMSDQRIAHIKMDTCHFLDFNNRQVYDGPFTAPGGSSPFYVQNPNMMWGGFSFPPAVTRTAALHQLGPFLEDQPYRRGWAESEFTGRFTRGRFVAAKSPRLLIFDHIGHEQASPGWEDHASGSAPRSPDAHRQEGDEQLIAMIASLRERGERDRLELEQRFPDLPAINEVMPPTEWRLFQQIHQSYCSSVSTAIMAASLEAIRLVCHLIISTKAKTIADLGSGLSSILLRLFIRTHAPGTEIVTADSQADWLRKTGEFIQQQGLPAENLFLWDDLRTSGRRFDLVFYDLGHVHELRSACFSEVLSLTTPNGYVVADDVHFTAYRNLVDQQASAAGRRVYHALHFTEDRFHRFCAVIAPPIAAVVPAAVAVG